MHENRRRFPGSRGKVRDLATEPVSWRFPFRLGGNSHIGHSSSLASFTQLLQQASHCGHLRIPSRLLRQWDEGLKAQMLRIPLTACCRCCWEHPTHSSLSRSSVCERLKSLLGSGQQKYVIKCPSPSRKDQSSGQKTKMGLVLTSTCQAFILNSQPHRQIYFFSVLYNVTLD